MGSEGIIAKPFDKRHFPSWGIVGSVIGLVSIIGRILNVGGYSEFGFFVSILSGFGLILAGIAFIPFMIGLGWYMDSRFSTSKLAAMVGMFYANAMVFVGVFETIWREIWIGWLSFLFSGMIMTGLWTTAIFLQRTVKAHRLLSLFGIVDIGLFAVFPLGYYLSTIFYFLDMTSRGFLISLGPGFWWIHRMVWVLHFAIMGYMLLLAIHIRSEEKETREPSVIFQQFPSQTPLPTSG